MGVPREKHDFGRDLHNLAEAKRWFSGSIIIFWLNYTVIVTFLYREMFFNSVVSTNHIP